jgi:hypothetical protein
MHSPLPGAGSMADEDDQWFKALAGQRPADDRSELSAQAAALRAAVLARSVTDAGEVRPTDPDREAALIAQALASGLLPPTTMAAIRPAAPAQRRPLRWAALAAALACLAIGVSLQMRTKTATVVLRGDSAGVVHLRTRDPMGLKQELLRELDAVGVHATGYENLGRQGIDADVPVPLPAAVRDVLRRHAIPLPTGGVLQIEIESDAGP